MRSLSLLPGFSLPRHHHTSSDRVKCCGTFRCSVAAGSSTLRELCCGKVPAHVLERADQAGFRFPTLVQREALPALLEHKDCVIHAQTGSGKTLAYMLPLLSNISSTRSATQAIVVVPTRELGIQVARVARLLGGGILVSNDENADEDCELDDERGKASVSVMTLLDGGTSSRQKRWLKAAPPQVIIGTLFSICRMIETGNMKVHAVSTIVVDEVDTAVHKGTQSLLSNLLTKYTKVEERQTIFASATVPQHNRFIHDCIQNKWAKSNLVHVYVRPEEKVPSNLSHRYVVCGADQRFQTLYQIVLRDAPRAAFIFANQQSSKARRDCALPKTRQMFEYFQGMQAAAIVWELLILEETMNINARFANAKRLGDSRFLLFATDLASRGLDVPEVTHVYNLELPTSTVSYIHRAGRTARKPLADEHCVVTTLISAKEEFVLRKIEHELCCPIERLEL